MDIITELAKINGYEDERYSDLVKQDVKQTYPSFADEIAIIRKEILLLLKEISSLKSEDIQHTEFIEYNDKIEAIKTKIKENTGLKMEV